MTNCRNWIFFTIWYNRQNNYNEVETFINIGVMFHWTKWHNIITLRITFVSVICLSNGWMHMDDCVQSKISTFFFSTAVFFVNKIDNYLCHKVIRSIYCRTELTDYYKRTFRLDMIISKLKETCFTILWMHIIYSKKIRCPCISILVFWFGPKKISFEYIFQKTSLTAPTEKISSK